LCELRSNKVGDEGLERLRRSGEQKFLKKLIRLAEEADIDVVGGIEPLLRDLSDWRHRPELRIVRKYRIGNHRVYLTGRNTDCRYTIVYVKVNKKSDVDREETEDFRSKILQALANEETRILE
jgi:hypothetical protein